MLEYMTRNNINNAIISMVESTLSDNRSNTASYCRSGGSKHQPHAEKQGIRDDGSNSTAVLGERFAWSPTTQGMVLGAFYYGYMVFQIPAGRLSELFGGKVIAAIGLIVSGSIIFVTPWIASSVPLLVTSRVALGLAQGLILPALFNINHKWMPTNERSIGFGVINTGGIMGAVIASASTGLISDSFGWKYSFFGIGALALLFALVIWLPVVISVPKSVSNSAELKKRNEDTETEKELHVSFVTKRSVPWIKLLSNPAVIAAACCRVGGSFGGLVMQTKLPAYLEDVLGLSASENGLLNSYLFIGAAVMAVVGPYCSEIVITRKWLSPTNTRKLFAAIANLPMMIGFILVPFTECNASLATGVLIVGNLFHGFSIAGEVIVPSEMSHHFSSTIYSGINMLTSIPGFLAPLIIGLMLEGTSDASDLKQRWDLVFFLTAGVTAFGTILFVLFGSAQRQKFDE
jgi:MFS family permease